MDCQHGAHQEVCVIGVLHEGEQAKVLTVLPDNDVEVIAEWHSCLPAPIQSCETNLRLHPFWRILSSWLLLPPTMPHMFPITVSAQ